MRVIPPSDVLSHVSEMAGMEAQMDTDPIFNEAVARRDRLQKELEDVERFLELYREFKTELEAPSRDRPTNAADAMMRAIQRGQDEGADNKASISQEDFEKEARTILLEHGQPMKRGQLVRAFKEKGISVGGANESKNLGTKIWRAGEAFVNIEGYGYWPADTPCPFRGYYPPGTEPSASAKMPWDED